MKKKTNNKKTIIIMLVVLLLILAVGYAAFSDILSISGIANAKGTFDLEFRNAEVVKNIGADADKTTAVISEEKETLTVTAADLSYPGSGVEFSVDIVNVGTMPAEVQAVTPTNITGSDKIKVTGLDAIRTNHPKLEIGDRCNIHFTVEWPVEAGEIPEIESSISFGLQIEYTQSTREIFNGTSLHTDTDKEGNTILPEYTIPTGLTAIYGNTLANVELPEGFKFQDALETPVGNVGTNQFKVTYTSPDNKLVKDIEVLIVVEKATPQYTVPTGLTANYGQKLENIKLPTGFKFQDSLETVVGNGGTDRFKVTYTPVDINNYNVVTDIEVLIKIICPTLVNQITAEDYGKSINYTATVRNQKVNNWKVLYNDKTNIYIVLDDFLPNNLLPSQTKLVIAGTHNIYDTVGASNLLNALTTQSYWEEFANGLVGATAIGSPKLDMLVKSYNEKYNENVNTSEVSTNAKVLNSIDTLYIPYQTTNNGVSAYWLSSLYVGSSLYLWHVGYDGCIDYDKYSNTNNGIRPVVKLPSTVTGIVGTTVEIK